MSAADRDHWDRRYADGGMAPVGELDPPPAFAEFVDLLPSSGSALDVACGRGRSTVWLARRGLDTRGVDVSPIAIGFARNLAEAEGLAERCRFDVVDLDGGLPDGPPVDLILCHLFRDPRLDGAMKARLTPGGVLAVAVLSEVGAGPGRFRAPPGELCAAFGDLELLAHEESDGIARLLGRADG